jgi:hypothetical protein
MRGEERQQFYVDAHRHTHPQTHTPYPLTQTNTQTHTHTQTSAHKNTHTHTPVCLRPLCEGVPCNAHSHAQMLRFPWLALRHAERMALVAGIPVVWCDVK